MNIVEKISKQHINNSKSDNCNTSLLHNGYSSHSYTLPVNSNFRIPQKKK